MLGMGLPLFPDKLCIAVCGRAGASKFLEVLYITSPSPLAATGRMPEDLPFAVKLSAYFMSARRRANSGPDHLESLQISRCQLCLVSQAKSWMYQF